MIDFDDASLAEACGAKVIFQDEEPAIVDETVPVVRDWTDLDTLRPPDPWNDGLLPVLLEATGGHGIFLSSRCVLGRNTKPENLMARIEASGRFRGGL